MRHSTVPPYLVVCPEGDFTQTVTVRDVNNSPLEGVDVVISLCAFTQVFVHLCPAIPGETIDYGCGFHARTDAFGTATFSIRAGGKVIAGSLIEVDGDYVYLGFATGLASPDQDRSGIVDAVDAALLAAKIATPNSNNSGDLNLDGRVDAADAAVLTAHLGHACATPTPVRAATWGQVRHTYR
jgi:hypothetical protein